MYSDILRSKRTLGWRTCLVIPELENEMAVYTSHKARLLLLQQLADRRDQLDLDIDAPSDVMWNACMNPLLIPDSCRTKGIHPPGTPREVMENWDRDL